MSLITSTMNDTS